MKNTDKINITSLYDLDYTAAKELLQRHEYPWEVLPEIGKFIIEYGKTLSLDEYDRIGENIWVSKEAKIYPTAYIEGPTVIGPGTEVRHCAFIRGKAIIGKNCVIGNSVELKNVIIFDNVQVPHFNYVGDSVLGHYSHMGAGSITSNIKQDKKNININIDGEKIETGMRKIGALLGDYVEVGCNTVLNPGTVVGKNVNIYPLSMVRGYVPESSIYKNHGEIVAKK